MTSQPSIGFIVNGPEKGKCPINGSCVKENALLVSEVKAYGLVGDHKKATGAHWPLY